MARILAPAVAALAVVIALAGCTPTPTPTPSPVAVETATPTPTADPVAASVAITAESIGVLDASGTSLWTDDYFGTADAAVAALTDAFGASPVEAAVSGIEGRATKSYTWDGFVLNAERDGKAPLYANYYVRADKPAVGAIALTTLEGVAVGSDTAVLASKFPKGLTTYSDSAGKKHYNYLIGTVDLGKHPEEGDANLKFAVFVQTSGKSGAVTSILSQSSNWGD
jgi:hypothetical protein